MPRTRPEPAARAREGRRHGLAAALRTVGFGLVFGAVAHGLGASSMGAVSCGLAAALVAVVERRCGLRDGHASRSYSDDDREAAARILALELACDRSESVVESLLEGVVVVDPAGEIVLANPAACRGLIDAGVEPIGQTLWDVLPDELADRTRESWEALRDLDGDAATGAGERPTVRHASVPSGDRMFDLAAVPVRSSVTGQDFGTVFLFVDTTRNHELQRLKDRFLSSVSHELRTPLTSIRAYSEILGTMVPGESMEWDEFVSVIHDESVRISNLVDGLFDFLQLQSGEAEFAVTALDANAVVQRVVDGLAGRMATRAIELELDLPVGERKAKLDERQWQQLVFQLVDNAVKFTPSGGDVRIAGRVIGDEFELRVEDSGPGVPADDRSTIFEKFTQLSDHLTEKPAGAGIGLAVCRAIAERSGGHVWCEDSALGGAAFVVHVPLATDSKQSSTSWLLPT